MAIFILVVLVASLSGACSAEKSPKIVGGNPAWIEEFPSIVQVQSYSGNNNWFTFCAGSILNEIYVLSAAHCFDELLDQTWDTIIDRGLRRIKAGTRDLQGSDGVNSIIGTVHMHPDYNPRLTGADDDICLCRLRTPLAWSDSIRPIAIPPQDFDVPHYTQTTYAGWGQLWWGGPRPNVLHSVTVPKIDHAECQRMFGQVIVSPRQLCAGLPGMSSCHGDSGGPLYFNNTTVIGVVSWGHYCGAVNPAVNSKVSSFTNWILATAV